MFLTFVLTTVFLFVVYFQGVSASVYGGDSGDVILASWFGGVAHPPGYPLNTMLGWVFTHIPYHATVAFKANLAAAFLQAVSAGVFFLVSTKLTKNATASLIAALIMAFNPLYWLYAHIYEVFQLNLMLIGLAVYYLLKWQENFKPNTKNKWKNFYVFSVFWGFAVFHHHTSVLLGPAFLYFTLNVCKKEIFKGTVLYRAIAFFLVGLVPYVFILYAATVETPINWVNPQTLDGFIRLITRADYGTFTAANFLVGSTLQQKFAQILHFFLFLQSDYSILGTFLILTGAVFSFIKARLYFWFITLSFALSGPFFLFYAGFPISSDFFVGLWERFVLTSYFFAAMFIAFGLTFLLGTVVPLVSSKIKIPNIGLNFKIRLITLCFFIIPFSLFLLNESRSDLSEFKIGDWLGHDILNSAETNAIVFLIGDTALFNTQYVYYSNEDYKDMKLIKAGSLAFLEYREQVSREFPELTYHGDFFTKGTPDSGRYTQLLIEANKNDFPIYIRDIELNIPDHKWVNMGLLKKLVPDSYQLTAENLREQNEKRFKNFRYNNIDEDLGYLQFMTAHIQDNYYWAFIALAIESMKLGDFEEGLQYTEWAKKLFPNRKEGLVLHGEVFAAKGECSRASEIYNNIIKIDPNDWRAYFALSKLSEECYKDEEQAKNYLKKSEEIKAKNLIELKSL